MKNLLSHAFFLFLFANTIRSMEFGFVQSSQEQNFMPQKSLSIMEQFEAEILKKKEMLEALRGYQRMVKQGMPNKQIMKIRSKCKKLKENRSQRNLDAYKFRLIKGTGTTVYIKCSALS